MRKGLIAVEESSGKAEFNSAGETNPFWSVHSGHLDHIDSIK